MELLRAAKLLTVLSVLMISSWPLVCCGGIGLGLGVIPWVQFSNDGNCLGMHFNVSFVEQQCTFIRVETPANTDNLAYARNVSSNYKVFQNITCGNHTIAVDRNATKEKLSVCFSASDLCNSSCELVVVCITPDSGNQKQQAPVSVKVAQLMCSEQGSVSPTVTTVEEVPVDVNSTETPGGTKPEKPCEERPSLATHDGSDSRILDAVLVTSAVHLFLFVGLVSIFHVKINNLCIWLKTWFRNRNRQRPESPHDARASDDAEL